MRKKLVIFFALLACSAGTYATHINGGSISYRYLGGNDYEITLIVYRDCYNGVPPFDYPASVGIFDGGNAFYTELLMYSVDSIYVFTPTSCMPAGICFARAVYTEIVNLPAASGTYTLAYQRCCRSQAIANLSTPLNYGMTFFTQINTAIQNNSALYASEIPGYTFVGDNFTYDASAYDLDGDSLSYELTDTYDGATMNDPMPQPPFSPPYNPLSWSSPYSVSDMLGGTVPLTIDPVTGVMNAVPGVVGSFQVGMQVKEYRSGNLINTQRREFLIFVSPANYFQLSGNIYADNGSQLLDTGNAWLVRKNLYDSTLFAVDTNYISAGAYAFPNSINGTYLVKGSADSISFYHPNNMPTYYGDKLFWYQATEVDLCTGNFSNIDINLLQGLNPGGPGFVGGFISQGANRMTSVGDPESGITVFLLDVNDNPVEYAVTDANGYFSMNDLPYGTYKVYIDKLNFINNDTLFPQLTLDAATPVLNNLSFVCHSNYLELAGFTAVSSVPVKIDHFRIQPNPIDHSSVLKYDLNFDSQVKFYISDISGRKIIEKEIGLQRKGNHDIPLYEFRDKLSKGIFLLTLSAGDKNHNLKFVVTE